MGMFTTSNMRNAVTKEQVEEIIKENQKEMLSLLKKDDEFIQKIAAAVSKLLEQNKKNEPVFEYLDTQKEEYYRDPNLT